MKKIKTSELLGHGLAWAAGIAEGYEMSAYGVTPELRARVPGQGVIAPWNPTQYYNQAGEIIDREGIGTHRNGKLLYVDNQKRWEANVTLALDLPPPRAGFRALGPTRLIAAMRCFVASRMGDTVEIPEELL